MTNQVEMQDAELEDLMAMLAAESVAIVKTLEKATPAPIAEVCHEGLEKQTGICAPAEGTAPLTKGDDGKLPTSGNMLGYTPPWEPTASAAPVKQVDPELAILAAEQVTDLTKPAIDHFAGLDVPPAADDLAARLKAALGGKKVNPLNTVAEPVVPKSETPADPVADPVVSVAARRVILNEDGTVKQPALDFSKKLAEAVTLPAQESHDVLDAADLDFNVVHKSLSGLDFCVSHRDFNHHTRVSFADLDNAFIQHKSLVAYYNDLWSKAAAQHSRQKALFDQIEAKLYAKHRSEILATGEKATKKMIEMAVRLDPLFKRAQGMVIDAQEIENSNKGFARAVEHNRDMLNMLGNDRRHEQKGAIRVLEEQQGREDLFSRARKAVGHG